MSVVLVVISPECLSGFIISILTNDTALSFSIGLVSVSLVYYLSLSINVGLV